MTQVKQEILDRVKQTQKAKNRLAYDFNKHIATIDRWLDDNNMILTTPTAVRAISEELGIPEDQILAEA